MSATWCDGNHSNAPVKAWLCVTDETGLHRHVCGTHARKFKTKRSYTWRALVELDRYNSYSWLSGAGCALPDAQPPLDVPADAIGTRADQVHPKDGRVQDGGEEVPELTGVEVIGDDGQRSESGHGGEEFHDEEGTPK